MREYFDKPQSKSPGKAEAGMPHLLTSQHDDIICKSMLQTHIAEMPKNKLKGKMIAL